MLERLLRTPNRTLAFFFACVLAVVVVGLSLPAGR